jgi:type II secretory pathway pseudopilin PulG
MAAALPFVSVIGSVASAGATIMQGKAQSEAALFEQQQLQIQEQQQRTAAQQAEARRREELTANLETIQSIRSGRGVGLNSPTGMAILSDTSADAQRDILTERSNYLTAADLSSRAATMAGRKAQTSLLAGYLGGASDLASGFGKLYGQSRV